MLSLLLFAGAATADPAKDVTALESGLRRNVSVADLVTYARETNPDIRAARQRLKAAEESYRVETGYPDPQVMVTYFPAPIETRLGPQEWNATLSQTVPYSGKLARAGEVASAKAEGAEIAFEGTVRDVVLVVQESFHELYYLQASREIVKQQMELFDNLINTTESAYAQDRVTLVAVINAHSHMDILEKDLLLIESMSQATTATLNSLLDRDPDAPFGELTAPELAGDVVDLETLYRRAEMNEDDIRMADTRIRQEDAAMDLARYQTRPDFKVGLFYAAIGSPDVVTPPENAGDDAVGIQFSMSIPLWGEKNKGRVAKALAQRDAAVSDKSATVNRVRAKVRSLYYNLEKSRGIITLYEDKLLPQAQTAVDAAETWFLAKRPDVSDFVEAQALWYQFQLALAKAKADYGKDLARLERIVGKGSEGGIVNRE